MSSTDRLPGSTSLPDAGLEREREFHRTFAQRRMAGYVEREAYHRELTLHAEATAPPILVTAPPGGGKSSLVAAWTLSFRDDSAEHPPVIEHYIGAGEQVGSGLGLIRHIMLELAELYDLDIPVPSTPRAIVDGFQAWLWYARRPTVLCIDGLENLPAEYHDLEWLPRKLPPSIRLILTSSSEAIAGVVADRGWRVLPLQPFSLDERRALVRAYISERHASLTADQQRKVAGDQRGGTPLLLRTRLEEARIATEDQRTDQEISRLLSTGSLREMYDRVIERLVRTSGPDLPRAVILLLHASNSGLTLQELTELSGHPLPSISSLLEGLDAYLLRIDDRITIYHSSFAEEAERYWPSDPEDRFNRRLADYFERRPRTVRNVRELLWQVTAEGDVERLVRLLTDIPLLHFCWRSMKYELLRHVQSLPPETDIAAAWMDAFEQFASKQGDEGVAEAAGTIGGLLQSIGSVAGAEEAYRIGVERTGGPNAGKTRAGLLVRSGQIRADRGELDRAEELLREAIDLLEEGDAPGKLASALNGLAAIAFYRGDLTGAREFFVRSLSLYRRIGDRHEEARVEGNIGAVALRLADAEEAIRRFRGMLDYAESIGDIRMEAEAASNLAVACDVARDSDDALKLLTRSLHLAEAIGSRHQIAAAHGNIGQLLSRLHRLDEALRHAMKQKEIAGEIDDQRQRIDALENMGLILMMMGRREEATAALHAALDAVQRIGDDYRETTLLSTLGYAAVRAGMGAEALEYYCRVRERSALPGMEGVALEGVVGTGHAYRIVGDLAGAGEAYRRALEAGEEIPEELRTEATGYLGMVTVAAGRVEEGEKMLDEAIAMSRDDLPTFDRATWLLAKGDLLRSRGEVEAGETCVREVLQMNLLRFDGTLRSRAERMAEELRTAALGTVRELRNP